MTPRAERNRATALWHRAQGQCARCGRPINLATRSGPWSKRGHLEVDWIVPPWRGGRDEPANLAAVHRSCRRVAPGPWRRAGLIALAWATRLGHGPAPIPTVRRVP